MSEDIVESVFTEFCEAWVDGKRPDPESFYHRFPSYEKELKERIEEFLFVTEGLKMNRGAESATAVDHVMDVEGKTLGDFRIEKEIGRGGMGVVYEARQISLDRTVAVKVLPAHLTLREESVKRFKREASTAARLSHPGIVEIYAVGEAEGNHFFAMELIEGTPLDRVISTLRDEGSPAVSGSNLGAAVASGIHRRKEIVEPAEEEEKEAPRSAVWKKTYIETVCRLAANVADALEYAHNAGVIHRDVKPSNILVREDGSCVLTDFGLAREEGLPSVTVTGEFAGTPHYISPEQAMPRRAKPDHRTDVYSLGITLYELLAWKRPFDGKTSQEVLGKIIAREAPLLRTLNHLIPRDLETICMAAMEKDPNRRYPSALALKEDIERFLEFKPIQARPAGVIRKTSRLIRRNPAYFLLFVLIFFVVVLGPVFFGFQQKLANIRIKREAEAAKQVSDFLVDLFKVVEPSEALGKRITAFEILAQSAARIEIELVNQPKIQARLQETMGVVYVSLGLYTEAEPLLASALATRRSVLGEDDPETLKSIHQLARLLSLKGRYDEAEKLFLEALEGSRRELPREHPETLSVMSDLGQLYKLQFRHREAEEFYKKALEAQRRLFGEEHEDTLETMNNLAFLYMQNGQYSDAETLYRRSYEGRLQVLGEEHPDTLTSMSDLGVLLAKLGRYEEARPRYEDSLEARERILGRDHPDTITSRYKLAMLCLWEKRYAEAEPLLMEAMEDRRRVLGGDHPKTHIVNTLLADLYAKQERYGEAEPLYRETLDALNEIVGPYHNFTLFTMSHLAGLLYGTGRYAEALPLARDALARTPENHPDRGERHALVEAILQETDGR